MQVTVEVTKEAYELGQGIAAFLGSVVGALKDGWNPLTDVPKIITAAVSELAPAVQGCQNLPAEILQGPAFANAIALSITGAWQAVKDG